MLNGNRNITLICLLVFGLFILSSCSKTRSSNSHTLPKVKLSTELGDIVIEVDTGKAPISAANFLRYVDENRFKTASFYRTVRMDNQPNNKITIEVIQGGIGFRDSPLRLPPIKHETTAETGILHKDGVISMARSDPGTASSEIFICIGNQPELDFGGKRNPDGQGFAAFGRVIEGMDVVKKIQSAPADEQMLLAPVIIQDILRIESAIGKE
ncbi:peptidylprolyl isomerase [Planctomycetota bacterium]